MLTDSERFKLHAGPYKPPRFKLGGTLDDRLRGPKRIIGVSDVRLHVFTIVYVYGTPKNSEE